MFTKSLNNKTFLRYYCYTMAYNKKGTNKFIHEHVIFCSNYFIKKLGNPPVDI